MDPESSWRGREHPHGGEVSEIVEAIRHDLADWRRWTGRVVVLAAAGVAGLAVVLFTWACDRAMGLFSSARAAWPWIPFVLTPACCALVVWLTRRHAAAAAGSGIPQVMAALSARVQAGQESMFVSLRLAVAKLLLTTFGLLGGLAIGREGPSVQIAAGIMAHAHRWLPRHALPGPHSLLVAGGAAGIAAAFNAPLAGIMFAIEELSRNLEQRNSGLTVSAIVLAGLIGISFFGNASYFGVIRVPAQDLHLVLPALATAVACGLAGGFFSRLLQVSLVGAPHDAFSRWRSAHPVAFAAACGAAIAAIGFVSGGATFGSGYDYTRHLLEGSGDTPVLYVTLRLVATWLSSWCGAPGGLFAPSLAIGAGIGHDVALLAGLGASPALIALGMASFLAAVTQAPLTAFIIVMEMVDGHSMVLSLMAAALGASLVSRWLSRPLYATLAQAQLERLARADETIPSAA